MQMHTFNRQPMPLVLIDLDHMKLINDTHGQPAGDAPLQSIVGTLSRVFLYATELAAMSSWCSCQTPLRASPSD